VLRIKKLDRRFTVADENTVPLVETPKQKAQHAKRQTKRSHNPRIAIIPHERDNAARNKASKDYEEIECLHSLVSVKGKISPRIITKQFFFYRVHSRWHEKHA
jgi:ribosomal protein S18